MLHEKRETKGRRSEAMSEEMSREVQLLVEKIDNLIAVFEQVSTVEEEEEEEEKTSAKEILQEIKQLRSEVGEGLKQVSAKLDEVVSLLDSLPARMPKFGAALAEEAPEDILGPAELVSEEEG